MSSDRSIVDRVVAQIIERLAELPDLSNQPVRAVRRQFTRQLAKAEPEVVIEIARRLVGRKGFHHRFVAYELVHYHRQTLRSLRERELVELAGKLDSWVTVDTFGVFLAGPCWRERQVPDSLIEDWARSKDRWWRRTALVCTVALNLKARGGSGDTKRTLMICRLLISDRDDMVVKAQSWALRSLSVRDRASVEKFLADNETKLAPRVLREVRNKLTTGLKTPKH